MLREVKQLRGVSLALILWFLGPGIATCTATEGDDCARNAWPLAQRHYPGFSLLKVDDLEEDLQMFWAERYQNVSPGCVDADFNGDGLSDFALLLKGEKDGLPFLDLVVLLQTNRDEYRAVRLDTLKDRLKSYSVRSVQPRALVSWEDRMLPTAKRATMEHVGFELQLFEAASRVYYWKDGAFVSVQTAE